MIFGIIGDNIDLFVRYNQNFDYFLKILFNTPEINTFIINRLIHNRFEFIIYNFLIFLVLGVNLIVIYKFFQKLFKEFILITLSLTLILFFSPYNFYRVSEHFALSNIWMIILSIGYLSEIFQLKKNNLKIIIIGVSMFVFSLISNYLVFFILIFTLIFSFIKSILLYKFNFDFKNKLRIKNIFFGLLLFSFFFLIWFSIYKHISYVEISNKNNVDISQYSRPLEDFFTFTSRPWYYFLPSIDNPFFGHYTKSAIDLLQNDWSQSWLATNYFPSEHSASYLGWVNFMFALVGARYIWGRVKEQKKVDSSARPQNDGKGKILEPSRGGLTRVQDDKRRKIASLSTPRNDGEGGQDDGGGKIASLGTRNDVKGQWTREMDVLILGLVAVCLVILTMPPFFTISGFKIYMPSYLLWVVFPMFRVLARLGVVILLIELIFTGYGYLALLNYLKVKSENSKFKMWRKGFLYCGRNDREQGSILLKHWSVVSFLIILPFFVVSLMEFYVPIQLTDVSTPPAVFTYIKNNTNPNAVIAVYPYEKTRISLFWMREYQRAFVNPRDFIKPEYNFSSEGFTTKLNTCTGLLEARNLGTNYLVYFYNTDKENIQNLLFFNSNEILEKVEQFLGTEDEIKDIGFWGPYVHINNTGNTISNSAIIYKIDDKIDCDGTNEPNLKL